MCLVQYFAYFWEIKSLTCCHKSGSNPQIKHLLNILHSCGNKISEPFCSRIGYSFDRVYFVQTWLFQWFNLVDTTSDLCRRDFLNCFPLLSTWSLLSQVCQLFACVLPREDFDFLLCYCVSVLIPFENAKYFFASL